MSGEELPIIFFYLLDFNIKNFKVSFVSELRRKFKTKDIIPLGLNSISDIHFDQIKLFDNENIYNFNYIPDNNTVFDIFIDIFIDNISLTLTDDEISYYKNIWKGEQFKTYLIWCQKKDTLKYIIVYCGSGDNLIMSLSFTDNELNFFIRISQEDSEPEWEFIDDISYLRYIYETGKTTIF
jgi:hypothetical protein